MKMKIQPFLLVIFKVFPLVTLEKTRWKRSTLISLKEHLRSVFSSWNSYLNLLITSAIVMTTRVTKRRLDWAVDHHADLFRTTLKVKTQQVARSRGQWCGDIELAGYLVNAVGPVPLVLDLRIAHDGFGSSSDLSINGRLHCPNDVDRSLNEAAADKIRKYRADYNNNRMLSPLCLSLRPGGSIVTLCAFYFYKLIGKLIAFLQLQEFSLRNTTVDSFTTTARRSPPNWNLSVGIFWLRLQQHYGLCWISTAHLCRQDHTLTHHTRKALVY